LISCALSTPSDGALYALNICFRSACAALPACLTLGIVEPDVGLPPRAAPVPHRRVVRQRAGDPCSSGVNPRYAPTPR
jgi:hypothetical protein